MQLYPFRRSVHVAPLIQGFGSHSFVSIHIYENRNIIFANSAKLECPFIGFEISATPNNHKDKTSDFLPKNSMAFTAESFSMCLNVKKN